MRLGPRRSLEIIDDGFAAIRARPSIVLGLAMVFTFPAALAAAFVQRGAFRDDTDVSVISGPGDLLTSAGDMALAGVAGSLIALLPLPFIAAAVAHLVGGWVAGQDASAAGTLAVVGSAAPSLLVAWVIVHVIELAGAVLLIVPGVVAMALLACTAPVVVLEGLGPWAAARRSWRLSARRFGPTAGTVLLIALISEAVGATLGFLPSALSLVAPEDVRWLVAGAGGSIARLVASTFAAAATVILYLDLRIRTEGLDLDLETRRLFPMGA